MKNKILVIDDDKDFIRSLRMILEPAGYQLSEAYSAKEGIGTVASVNPDLIILDVMMETETAGFHLAYELKSVAGEKKSAYAHIPILMLTSIGGLKEVTFDKTADGNYLPVEEFAEKPLEPKLLLETVKRLLEPGKGAEK